MPTRIIDLVVFAAERCLTLGWVGHPQMRMEENIAAVPFLLQQLNISG